ncbi:hypothetical protein [Salinigranum salinum]|uniref:hypothetical protein n=1 Tax=Salinigranum salinum TaxID=1364937 RepID=UPI001260C6B7|nr:hypothetical protein [Salinigranum salinum]
MSSSGFVRSSSSKPHDRHIELVVEASVPGIDEATFVEYAEGAKENCPVSRVLAGAEITPDAPLIGHDAAPAPDQAARRSCTGGVRSISF